jgi:predicted transcriptional regulator of viral defense system
MKQHIEDYIKELRKRGKPCFTLNQATEELNSTPQAVSNAISRLKLKGDLISPAKGLYVIVPPENQIQGCITAEELTPILMKFWERDYYVSLLSGATFYGASHQPPGRFQIVTNKRLKHPLVFGKVKLSIVYKKSLLNLPYKDFVVSTGYLKVATPELIVFDLFSYPTQAGGLNHIATVLTELVEALDADKFITLANQTQEKAWLQRFGYILEKIDPLEPNQALLIIEKLQQYLKDKSLKFVPLAANLPIRGCAYANKWKIIENTSIESDL